MTEPDVDRLAALEFVPRMKCERGHHDQGLDGCKPSEDATYYLRVMHGHPQSISEDARARGVIDDGDIVLVIAICLSSAAYIRVRAMTNTQCPTCGDIRPLSRFAEVLGPINPHGPK